MAYRFKLDEPIQAGVRRIGGAQIDRALTELTSKGGASTAVHEARKSLKRIRALLRLVRPAIGEAVFTRENGFYRETGMLLSHVRDREILLDTVIKLAARFADPPDDALARLRQALSVDTAIGPGADVAAAARAEAASRLAKARVRFRRLKLDPDGFDALAAGLDQSFRRAARSFQEAYDDPSDHSVHEWRKGVQQHWRHMQLLRRAWPEMADTRMQAARRLSQILGDDHDLAILQHTLEANCPAGLNTRDVRSVTRAAVRRQAELRAFARPLGDQLFADRPRSLSRRFAVYWTAACALRAQRAAGENVDEADS